MIDGALANLIEKQVTRIVKAVEDLTRAVKDRPTQPEPKPYAYTRGFEDAKGGIRAFYPHVESIDIKLPLPGLIVRDAASLISLQYADGYRDALAILREGDEYKAKMAERRVRIDAERANAKVKP